MRSSVESKTGHVGPSRASSLRLLDISFRKPEENLAFDEILLDGAETGKTGEAIRFWESAVPFVVLGVSQALRQEVYDRNCQEDGVPVLRRCSAGGCVLQGKGCLNFTLILSHERRPEIQTLRGSYCYILDRLCAALQYRGVLAHHKGISDLAVAGKKVSGSAQKRRRNYILHHGTLLYACDLEQMEHYLREPAERPQYRGPRTHRGFVQTIPLAPHELRAVVREAFDVADLKPTRPYAWELRAAKALAKEKYTSPDWILRR